jgi:hypothetical protein
VRHSFAEHLLRHFFDSNHFMEGCLKSSKDGTPSWQRTRMCARMCRRRQSN